jgi:hypothetical protein
VRVRRVIVCLLLLPVPARAYDFDLYAETVGQGYQLRAADDALVNRRRLTQSLGLDMYNLGPKDVVGRPLDRNQFFVSVALRFDAELSDFGDLKQLPGHTAQREIDPTRLDLIYAYLGGRNLFGVLDFRLGRQIFVDLFDYQSIDGLWLQAKTPLHLAVEAWGGLNVDGAAVFDSPVYRTDGVALGGNPQGSLGARQEDALQPTFGVALATLGLRDVTARLSYDRTVSFTGSARQPGEPASGVIDEKVAITARGRLWGGRLVPWFGLRYNVLAGLVDEVHAGLRLMLGRHALQAEYVYSAPTFDGDSIWNVFGAQAFNDARLTYDLALGRLRAFARAFVRLFDNQSLSQENGRVGAPDSLGLGLAAGGTLGARCDWRRGYLRVDGYYEDGYGGTKGGVDLAGRVLLFGEWVTGLVGEGRLSFVHFRDDARAIDHADSFGVQAGLRYSFLRGLTVHLAVEENVNRFYASQFRALALVDLSFWIGPRGGGFPRTRPGLF